MDSEVLISCRFKSVDDCKPIHHPSIVLQEEEYDDDDYEEIDEGNLKRFACRRDGFVALKRD